LVHALGTVLKSANVKRIAIDPSLLRRLNIRISY
jgi:hypothetical protein